MQAHEPPFRDYAACTACSELKAYGAECPPTIRPYPAPVSPVRLLCIGWNPPSPGGGFWSRDDDHLLDNVQWIFHELGWTTATTPAAFREEFRRARFYFIHAVKCFSRSQFPQGTSGTKLLDVCARTHLQKEVVELRPERICVFGQMPLRALKRCFSGLPSKVRSLEGAEAHIRVNGHDTPVLITCFPNGQQGPGVQRLKALEHLRRWPAARDLCP